MAQRQHLIELNGQKYDALTGQLFSTKTVSAPTATVVKPAAARQHTAAKAVHHKTQRSQTLMRNVVKKPLKTPGLHSVNGPLATKNMQSMSGITKPHHKPLITTDISIGRAIRADHTSKSALVSKFGNSPISSAKTAVVPVAPAPSQATPNPVTLRKQTTQANSLFEKAMAASDSHTQPAHQLPGKLDKISNRLNLSRRALTFTSVSLLFVIVGSLAAYQGVPVISMKLASSRAGVRAGLPGYQPAGFSIAGPIESKPGEVKIDYKSNSDDRSYQVVQRSSNWNSQALLDNFIASNRKSYQTVESNGRTIYVYEAGNASWVDGGIWYQINGSKTLSSDQLLNLAKSL